MVITERTARRLFVEDPAEEEVMLIDFRRRSARL